MSAQIIRGDARHLPLPDESVDLVCTSPPYFALRSYQDQGIHYSGQVGSEPTPAEFLDALIACTREMMRVLKPSGSIWINLGDKYAQDTERSRNGQGTRQTTRSGGLTETDGYLSATTVTLGRGRRGTIPRKSLMGLPWRYALRCIDELGLILRAEVIWSKPNGLPESVTDRPRRSHEQWFMFTVLPRYYAAVDTIREPQAEQWRSTGKVESRGTKWQETNGAFGLNGDTPREYNPLGKLPGSVWTINEGPSLIRIVLDAVAAGALTPEEGERIWMHAIGSYLTSIASSTAVGSGWDGPTNADTARQPQSADVAKTGHTESPTNYSLDLSLMGSPSTTSAEIPPASTPPTSSPSLSERTSAEPVPSAPFADTDTAWTMPISTSHLPDSVTRDVVLARLRESDIGESVWSVPSQPLRIPPEVGVDHFAAFPSEFPRRIIQGWSPSGVCTGCGEGRRPTFDRELVATRGKAIRSERDLTSGANSAGTNWQFNGGVYGHYSLTMTGDTCACPDLTAPTQPAVILDPFGGTGTVALLADVLGRHGITVDMSADYSRAAVWRTTDPGERARAMQVDKPEPVMDGQLGLFEGSFG